MRPGKEPHGAPENVRKDQAARKAIIKEKAGTRPDEAVIVEENCRPDKKLAAVTMQGETRQRQRPGRQAAQKQPGRTNGGHGHGSTPAQDATARPRKLTKPDWFH